MATPDPRAESAAWYGRHRRSRMTLAMIVGAVALVLVAVVWLKDKFLTIDPGKGAPIGWSVRTHDHVATLIQTLEAYTPSPARDHGRDTYAISLFVAPLDGPEPVLVRISGGHAGNSLGLARVLGGDGQRIWYDVNGLGAVDLTTFKLVPASALPATPPQPLQGALPFPLTPRLEAHLASGLFTDAATWLGALSDAEAQGAYAPGQWLRAITHAEGRRQPRRLYHVTLGDSAGTGSRKIMRLQPLDTATYIDAAFLRLNDKSTPLRLHDPDGVLMVHTSAPGVVGTTVVTRLDMHGRVHWRADTGIDRFQLEQLLPGAACTALIGTRPPVPGKVSEPLLVIVHHADGRMVTHSLWQ